MDAKAVVVLDSVLAYLPASGKFILIDKIKQAEKQDNEYFQMIQENFTSTQLVTIYDFLINEGFAEAGEGVLVPLEEMYALKLTRKGIELKEAGALMDYYRAIKRIKKGKRLGKIYRYAELVALLFGGIMGGIFALIQLLNPPC